MEPDRPDQCRRLPTEFDLPNPNSGPAGITAGPEDDLWFAELFGNRIGRITSEGAITEFELSNPNSGPRAITADRHGNIWFAEFLGNRIGRLSGLTRDDED